MKMTRLQRLIVLCALAALGCWQALPPQQAMLPAEHAATEPQAPQDPLVQQTRHAAPICQPLAGPVLGHLETREKLVTIRSNDVGPLYTVKSQEGTILSVDLPMDQLLVTFPELRGIVERGVANRQIWAGN